MTRIDSDNMRNGFNWRSGTLDSSVIIDPKLQHVRARNPLLYRSSIFTDDGARAEYRDRHMILPNELNLRLNQRSPPMQIVWRAPQGFDATKFNVSQRMQALGAEYQLVLERDQEGTDSTSNAAGHQRRARTARTNAGTLLPPPTVIEPFRQQRQARRRSTAVLEYSSEIEGTHSEESSSSERSNSSDSSDERSHLSDSSDERSRLCDSSPSEGSECSDSPRTGSQRHSRNHAMVTSSYSGEDGDEDDPCSCESESSSSSSSSSSSEQSSECQHRVQRHRRARSPPQTRRRRHIDSTPEYSTFSDRDE